MEHRKLCKPVPQLPKASRKSRALPGANPGAAQGLGGGERDWATQLRLNNAEQMHAEWLREQKDMMQRREDGLRKLKAGQRRWRKSHVEWRRRRAVLELAEEEKEEALQAANSKFAPSQDGSSQGGKSGSHKSADRSDNRSPRSGEQLELPRATNSNRSSPSCSDSETQSKSENSETVNSSPFPPRSQASSQLTNRSSIFSAATPGERSTSANSDQLMLRSSLRNNSLLEAPKALLRRTSQSHRHSLPRTASIPTIEELPAAPGGDEGYQSFNGVLAGGIEMDVEIHQRERRRSLSLMVTPADDSDSAQKTNSKQKTLAIIDLDQEEEDLGGDSEDEGKKLDPLQIVQVAYQQWEEWRKEFPMEVLNQLSNKYESWEMDDSGLSTTRVTTVGEVEEVCVEFLGWNPKIIRSALKAQGVLKPQPSEQKQIRKNSVELAQLDVQQISSITMEEAEAVRGNAVHFSSLPKFLDLIRSALELAELEEPEALWSEWDYQALLACFRNSASAKSQLPVGKLFQSLQALDFAELQLTTAEQQRWLANITKLVLASKVISKKGYGQPGEVMETSRVGMLSFRDYLRIASMALRDSERARRIREFAEEKEAQQRYNFGLLELEDMRQLYETFAEMYKPNNKGVREDLDKCMMALLKTCNAEFEEHDEERIQEILSSAMEGPTEVKGGPAFQAQRLDDEIKLNQFISWILAIFHQGVILQGPSELTVQDLENRKGFAASMLREQLEGGISDQAGRKSADSQEGRRLSVGSIIFEQM